MRRNASTSSWVERFNKSIRRIDCQFVNRMAEVHQKPGSEPAAHHQARLKQGSFYAQN